MPPVTSREEPLDNYPDSPLKRDMLKREISIRGLAKKLAGSDDLREIDKERTNVKRWLDPDNGISHDSAARLAPFFRRPADYYYRRGKQKVRQEARLEALSAKLADQAALIARMAEDIQALKDAQVAATPQRGRRRRAGGAA